MTADDPQNDSPGVVLAAAAPQLDSEYQRRLSEAFTDDITWLTLGKTLLQQTIPTINEQAKNLGTSIGWFWTIYSSIMIATTALSQPRPDVLFIAPIFTLLAAYVVALTAQSPIIETLDLHSVEEIRDTIESLVAKKNSRIRVCVGLLILTAVLIGAGLAV